MTRVKRGATAHKKRESLLKHTKGFRWGRKSKERAAKEALIHAWQHAYTGRKEKKRTARTLWNVKINAALKEDGLKYSTFIDSLNKSDIKLDRKVLAEIASSHPEAWKKLVSSVKEQSSS
ncbi:MAG: 50S ribosomal protein L20 [Candidatus Colwellbacteria bacterium]|nr:50S ribosomal protein L20 [Candidatus Colwellbacteria bacterium]MCK9497238.1 50S ribosomal protein L20 [Candidatus Colwellbacteria bacterium]MDD3752379.1 50S ribosomal protein L20 [Candidatus Colwellbacteria bacterium]MDD4818656.1 50S ribosomal protein L20 [Candidatus Colwellbacteria bacterium]